MSQAKTRFPNFKTHFCAINNPAFTPPPINIVSNFFRIRHFPWFYGAGPAGLRTAFFRRLSALAREPLRPAALFLLKRLAEYGTRMKRPATSVLFLCGGLLWAQHGIGTSNPSNSAALDIVASNKGLLIPRVGLTASNTLAPIVGTASQAQNGLLVYNVSNTLSGKGLYYYDWNPASNSGFWRGMDSSNFYESDGRLTDARTVTLGAHDLRLSLVQNASRFIVQTPQQPNGFFIFDSGNRRLTLGLGALTSSHTLDVNGSVRFRGLGRQTQANIHRYMVVDAQGVLGTLAPTSLPAQNVYTSSQSLTTDRVVTHNNHNLRVNGTGGFSVQQATGSQTVLLAANGGQRQAVFGAGAGTAAQAVVDVRGEARITRGGRLRLNGGHLAFTTGNNINFTRSGNDLMLHSQFLNNNPSGNLFFFESGGEIGIYKPNPGADFDLLGFVGINGTYSLHSDRRYKTSIRALEPVSGRLMQLRPVRYRFDRKRFPDRRFPDSEQLGLIAQAVADLFPELAMEDQTGYFSMDYDRLPVLLLAGFQEQTARMAALQKTIAALQSALGLQSVSQ